MSYRDDLYRVVDERLLKRYADIKITYLRKMRMTSVISTTFF
jgi:hypothetical protein